MTDASTPPTRPNVGRVEAAAAAAGLVIAVIRFPAGTRTAEDAARAVGCAVSQIVKSLVFVVDGDPVVALVAGSDRLDPVLLATALGAQVVRRADGDEVRAATGFAIGGVPPFGHARPLRVVLDGHLLEHDLVWAAAGLPDAVFSIEPAELARVAGAQRASIAADSGS